MLPIIVKNLTTTLIWLLILTFPILFFILKISNINPWLSLIYVVIYLTVGFYFRYINRYYLPEYLISMALINNIFIMAISLSLSMTDAESINILIPNFKINDLIYFIIFTAHFLLIIGWMKFDYKIWWSQNPPKWLKENAEIKGNHLFLKLYDKTEIILLISTFGILGAVLTFANGFNDHPIGLYLGIFITIPIICVLTWAVAKILNIYFQLRKIEKQRGVRFIFWDMEKIQRERSNKWFGRLINPELRHIHAQQKQEKKSHEK